MRRADNCAQRVFTVEVRERYSDVVSQRWPGVVKPEPQELLSSWVHRLAIANGIPPSSFAKTLGLGDGASTARLDLQTPQGVARLLSHQTGVPLRTILAMSLESWTLKSLLLPLRFTVKRGSSTWLQYCPQCLATDRSPYFRSHWRLATRVSCFIHHDGLRDSCPSCRNGIRPFDQRQISPHHLCASCGFDLRLGRKTAVTISAQRWERAVDAICRPQTGDSSAPTGDFLARLRGASRKLRAFPNRPLTSLSAAARRRCFDWLGETDDD